MNEKVEVEQKKETYKTKFRLLAIISLAQSLALWIILYYNIDYHFSVLENVLVVIVVVVFYALAFAKHSVRAIINKVLDW